MTVLGQIFQAQSSESLGLIKIVMQRIVATTTVSVKTSTNILPTSVQQGATLLLTVRTVHRAGLNVRHAYINQLDIHYRWITPAAKTQRVYN